MDSLTGLVGGFEARRESIVIEGVHLAPNAVLRLMARHPSVVPFLVYIRCAAGPSRLSSCSRQCERW